jgi:hypothetical protein
MASVYSQNDVLAALQVFQAAPDKDSIERANTFLSDFQHSVIGQQTRTTVWKLNQRRSALFTG